MNQNFPEWSYYVILIHFDHPDAGFDSIQAGRAITFFCPEKEGFFAGVDVDQRPGLCHRREMTEINATNLGDRDLA